MPRPTPCLVFLCENSGKHLFPKNETRKAQWIQAIEYIKPGFSIQKHSKICSAHFRPTDFYVTLLSLFQNDIAPKKLNRTAVPSIFPWKPTPEDTQDQETLAVNVTKIKHTYSRIHRITFVEEPLSLDTASSDFNEDPLTLSKETDSNLDNPSHQYNTDENVAKDIKMEIAEDIETALPEETVIFLPEESETALPEKSEIILPEESEIVLPEEPEIVLSEEPEIVLTEETTFPERRFVNTERNEQSVQTEDNSMSYLGFSIHHYKHSDKAIKFFTGLENFKTLTLVFQTLGQQCKDELNYFNGKPPPELDALEQFFITLLILRRNYPFKEISIMFQITIEEVYNIFISWIQFMCLQWKDLALSTDCESAVLDKTECHFKNLELLLTTYNNRNTLKFLIGIMPSGLISYVSPCCGRSDSDSQFIERRSILSKFDYDDKILLKKGFDIQDISVSYSVRVNIPSYFQKKIALTQLPDRKVSKKKLQVQKVIRLLKTFKILSNPMNQTLSSNIVFICSMLVNFRSSMINKTA